MDGDETLVDHGSDYLMFPPLLFAQNSPPLEKLLTQFLHDDNEYEFKQQDSCSQDEVSAPKLRTCFCCVGNNVTKKQISCCSATFSPAEGRLTTVSLSQGLSFNSVTQQSINFSDKPVTFKNTHSCFEGFPGTSKTFFIILKDIK